MMIDEYYTFMIFGYHSDDLSPYSGKPIVGVCDNCGLYRRVTRSLYRDLCHKCAVTTAEHRKLVSNIRRAKGIQMYNKVKMCHVCGCELIAGNNTTSGQIKHRKYICNRCAAMQARKNEHLLGRHLPMNENRECALYLGVTVAERVLSAVFDNVKRMPHGNPGYDFICNKGYKIDVKCTCVNYKDGGSGRMSFNIRKNTTADYFLCLVFDNRESLTALNIWLLPGNAVNHLGGISISNSTIHKWDQYKIDKIDDIITCCDVLRGD